MIIKNKKINKLFLLTFLGLVFFVFSKEVKAAEIFCNLANKEIGLNQDFKMDFYLNTENKSINAIEGSLVFSKDILKIKEINDGDSFVSFWIEKPKITNENNEIFFSGIVPNGYSNKKGLLFSLFFETKKEGSSVVKFNKINILENNGLATKIPVKLKDVSFSVIKQDISLAAKAPIVIDSDPPEKFKISLNRDPLAFDNQWFLIFATQDKGSGIRYFELKEDDLIDNETVDKWEKVESPYLLKNQNLTSKITIKAVDRAGNETISVLEPTNQEAIYKNNFIHDIIKISVIFSLLILFFVLLFVWKRKFLKK